MTTLRQQQLVAKVLVRLDGRHSPLDLTAGRPTAVKATLRKVV